VGFSPEGHSLVISGLCRDCRSAGLRDQSDDNETRM
jgi:hypothetical protein